MLKAVFSKDDEAEVQVRILLGLWLRLQSRKRTVDLRVLLRSLLRQQKPLSSQKIRSFATMLISLRTVGRLSR